MRVDLARRKLTSTDPRGRNVGRVPTSAVALLVLAGALGACSGSERDASDSAVSGTPSAVAASAVSTASAVPPASTGPGKVSALMVTSAHDAQVVLGDDGMDHVEYELIVLNVFAEPVTLTSVQVLDPDGRQLLSIEGDALNALTQTLLTKTPGATVPASASVGVDVDVIVPAGAAPATVYQPHQVRPPARFDQRRPRHGSIDRRPGGYGRPQPRHRDRAPSEGRRLARHQRLLHAQRPSQPAGRGRWSAHRNP